MSANVSITINDADASRDAADGSSREFVKVVSAGTGVFSDRQVTVKYSLGMRSEQEAQSAWRDVNNATTKQEREAGDLSESKSMCTLTPSS